MPDFSAIDRLSRELGNRLSWLFLIAAALTCYEVIMDTLFRAPTIWVHDATTMMTSTCFLFGGAYALQRREHIRITFVYDLLPPAAQRICDVLGLVLALVFLLALAWFAGGQASGSIRIMEMSGRAWNFPLPVVIRTAFFLGTVVLALQAVAHLLAAIRDMVSGRE